MGRLGIFVSAGVARKEHGEFSSNIDLIDALPSGLYEAVFEKRSGSTHAGKHAEGDWVMRCEARNRVFETCDEIIEAACDAWQKLTAKAETITSIGMQQWAHVGQTQ